MNPTAVLALLADLYGQVLALTEENEHLRKELANRGHQDDPGT